MDGLFPEHVSRLGPPSCPRWDVEGDTPVCAGSLGLCHGQELRERTTRSPLRARDGQTGGPGRREGRPAGPTAPSDRLNPERTSELTFADLWPSHEGLIPDPG